MTDSLLALVIGLIGVILAAGYVIIVSLFCWQLRRACQVAKKALALPAQELPHAEILISLRGWDPYLTEALHSLATQDYPHYGLTIVVDSKQDPAWAPAQELARTSQIVSVRVFELSAPLSTCSRKTSGLLTGIQHLPDECAAIALVDADVVAHSTWLRELLAPLADPQIGATTGQRWYLPLPGVWGTWVRGAWCAAATTQLLAFGYAWGGTIGLRRSILSSTALREHWEHALTEDLVLTNVLRANGLKTQFVPTMVMSNREATSLFDCWRWTTRQQTMARLYQQAWWLMALCGLIGGPVVIGLPILALCAWLAGWPVTALTSIIVPTGYLLLVWSFWGLIHRLLSSVARQPFPPSAPDWGRSMLAICGATIMQTISVAEVLFTRRMNWRGIIYQIKGPYQIQVVSAPPLEHSATPSQVSI